MPTILVIDIDESTVDLIKGFHSDDTYSIEYSNRGDEGLEMAKQSAPDLIILNADVHAGFTYCRRIRRTDTIGVIPMILISEKASDDQFEEHKRLSTRADEYLHKPLETADFQTCIETLLKPKEPVPEVAADPQPEVESTPSNGNGNGNGHGQIAATLGTEVPILDPNNPSQKQEREDRSMALMAKELQELRVAYAKLLESNERGGSPPVAAPAPPDESMKEQMDELLSQCAVLEGEKSNLTERVEAMELELETLRSRAGEDESLRRELEAEVDQLEKKLAVQNTTIEQFQEALQQQASQQNDGAVQASIQAIDEALHTARQIIADLQASSTSDQNVAQEAEEAPISDAVAGFEL